MARSRRPTRPASVDYVTRTRELPVNLLFLMPWLLVYQLALLGSQSPVQNAAGAWITRLLGSLGRDGLLAVSLLTCGLLCVVVLHRIRQAPHDRGVFGGMVVEGLVYGALLGMVAKVLADHLPLGRMVPLAAPSEALRGVVQEIGLAVGAGIFEEVVFRGVLLLALWTVLRHVVGADRLSAGIVAVLASAWVFSAYHHWGPGGEPYVGAVFAFRFWAGVALGAIFVTRGLGIAAFAHGFYDALVLVGR